MGSDIPNWRVFILTGLSHSQGNSRLYNLDCYQCQGAIQLDFKSIDQILNVSIVEVLMFLMISQTKVISTRHRRTGCYSEPHCIS